MRTFGLLLVLVAVLGGLLALFRTDVPFEIPVTAPDAAKAALFLFAAGAMALLGSKR